jgi:catechol 2,3-dioxygenase-like lactoylglutathione lyase family enzyme
MHVSAIQSCTLGVSDLEHALVLFRDLMRLKPEREGTLGADELAAYHLPPSTRAHYVELSAGGYPVGRLRLIEYSPAATAYVRADHEGGDSGTDIGPKAIDFYVADPIAPRVAEIERAGYRFRSRPIRHVISGSDSEECLFSGPDGVPVLIMVGHRHTSWELRPGCLGGPYSEIATISVVTGDLEATRAFYEDTLGLVRLVDDETGAEHRNSVNDLTGVPADTRIHFRVYAERGEPSGKILVVHFFERTGVALTGRMRPGRLGFSLMTHAVTDLDALHAKLVAGGYSVFTPPTRVRTASGERRVLLAEGPNEELFEFFEAGPSAMD